MLMALFSNNERINEFKKSSTDSGMIKNLKRHKRMVATSLYFQKIVICD